ncbi:helix-turn-helix domain-containing protein [Kordia sp.]|uniref:helix-turn-helix domain-containing protein n=1 Tax=Kordia sp. TaxID=1965332 RepID=UPI003D2A3D24
MDYKIALEYLNKKGVTAQQLANHSGLSKGSLYSVLNGDTQNPRKNTKDAIISLAKALMQTNNEVLEAGVVISADEDILDKKDKNYIKKLALEIRENRDALFEEQAFKDFIYIETLKMVLLAKEGDSVSMEKLVDLNK